MATPERINLDPDFKEFIASLNSEGVRYLLVGGYAVNYYGHHRFTGDIDFWIAVDPANARRVSAALQRFGFSAATVPPAAFEVLGKIHMFGNKPLRVDLLTDPSGVDFDDCYARRVTDTVDGVTVPIISLADLRKNKLASGRPKDMMDLDELPPAS